MKFISYFLPQFYPTPENDKYWGKNFTDWVNVKSAKPIFEKHRQPITPAEFGYYNLSDLSTFQKVCTYSIDNGIDGFGYWHYWFGNGVKTLEKVQEMHLSNRDIKQNFFFAWANQDWTKSWVGDDDTLIFEQLYSKQSAIDHFNYIKPFIEDDRYLRKDGKPMFQVINPESKGCVEHIMILEQLAIDTFGKGFYWLFPDNRKLVGLDGLYFSRIGYPPGDVTVHDFLFKIKKKIQKKGWIKKPIVISEKGFIKAFRKSIKKKKNSNSYFPCLLAGWDNTPRYKKKGFLIDCDISALLTKQIDVLEEVYSKDQLPDIVFIKAWNEWAEGNVLEPYSYNAEVVLPLLALKKYL